MAVLGAAGLVHLQPFDLAGAYTYTMNYYEARSFSMGHLWSLAVEEQFYLLWPVSFLLLGRARSITALKWVLLTVPLLRMIALRISPAFDFIVWSDGLATDCLLTLTRDQLETSPAYRRWFFTPAGAALASVVAVWANYIPSSKLSWLVGETIMNLCIALVVHWVITHQNSAAGRILNWPPARFLGVLSYSSTSGNNRSHTSGCRTVWLSAEFGVEVDRCDAFVPAYRDTLPAPQREAAEASRESSAVHCGNGGLTVS
jgi:peptidoglycan/LPS O-acetylase OafA/YrhL